MSTTTQSTRPASLDGASWQADVLGAAVMAVLVLLVNEATLAVAIPSLYGLALPANPAVGIAVHISHGAVLGVVFAVLAGAATST